MRRLFLLRAMWAHRSGFEASYRPQLWFSYNARRIGELATSTVRRVTLRLVMLAHRSGLEVRDSVSNLGLRTTLDAPEN
ncbi:MAG: hypothetical protein IIB09_05885 [Bacteroidetes bacterium]|nr:hypothetical protein [Bacteroidota bacterium]